MSSAETSTKPRRRDPKNTRERLVRAALDLFTTQGYHASTTPQVARRAGVAASHTEAKSKSLTDDLPFIALAVTSDAKLRRRNDKTVGQKDGKTEDAGRH